MDSLNSFKGYGKVDPVEEQAFRKKTRKRLIILAVSLVLLLVLIIGVVAGTLAHNKKSGGGIKPSTSGPSSAQSLKAMCSVTQNPDSCFSSISAMEEANSTSDPKKLFHLSLQLVMGSLEKLSGLPETWMKSTSDPELQSAFRVCQVVFQDATDAANDTISLFSDDSESEDPLSGTGISDLKTWLSTSLTNLETCLDALGEVNATATTLDEVKSAMTDSTQFASNSLAIVSKFLSFLDKFHIPSHRKLLSEVDSVGFPSWVKAADRKLLQAPAANPKPDLVVAADGSGDVKTITEALGKVPKKSKTRFVIFVKAGTYNEKVTVEKQMWNVFMYGDGKDKTIVTAAVNFIDGTRTLLTATFTVLGKGFVAKNMCFQNSAGASKHQAVALRSTSDQSVFYNCSFDAYQDTLYSHTNRQFYSNCDITGTVDFIFGNAAAIYQNCNIMPRQPLPNQFVTITAQGKIDVNQNTGIMIQNCNIYPKDKVTVKVYLGRPWKAYSTTIFALSTINGPLEPQGWIEWTFGVTPPPTIFYAEYQNRGPAAAVTKRVTWPGYKSSLTPSQLAEFSVPKFLNGQPWITAAQVTYT
ncbi:OLC1v1015245C1 [Oldenlandia corymbosa var. corymbosa]|uniref:Pectinesterase n=1 Tax=Oldenlandia corymbosa var. corymbosa TaxID=529605 RepID=A0AAV1E6B0_OLDCO|nr:OLC1v1015245C1 [Oldenlandia corymbosa var. corymbosa]